MPTTKPNVAALIEQMPETDNELQSKQEAAGQQAQPDAPDQPKQKPGRGEVASKFTGPDPAAAEKIFGEILSGGRDSILELLGLVREPSDADYRNYKAGYVLHGLVIYVGRAGQESQRRLLAETLASQLASDRHSKAARGFFMRELQVIGGPEAVSELGKQLLDEELGQGAVQALLAIREGAPARFRKALAQAKGRNRLAILQALGVVQDTGSVKALKTALVENDREVRHTAAWALANIGDASAAVALLQFADRAAGWERARATGYCLLLAGNLAASGKNAEATRIYRHLRDTRTDQAERHVRDAAENALGAMLLESRPQ